MSSARVLLPILLLSACHKAGSVDPAVVASAFQHLPGDAVMVAGMSRTGSEKEAHDAIDALKTNPVMAMAHIPPCAFDVYAALELAVVATKPKSEPIVYLHGHGLRAALEACVKTAVPGFSAADEGKVTHYKLPSADGYVLWLDADSALAGPWSDAKATAALGELTGSLAQNSAAMKVVTEADPQSPMWGVVFVDRIPDAKPEDGIPMPKTGWVNVSTKLELHAAADMASADDAKKLVAKLEELRKGKMPPQLDDLVKSATISADGARVTISAKLGSLLALMGPSAGKAGESSVTSIALVGVLAAVAIPSFMKYEKKAKSVEARISVKRIADGAKIYYAENAAVPPSTEITPPLGSCCHKGGKCAPNPSLWTSTTWQALAFSVDDPSAYSYQFRGDASGFTINAYGDLDCNGIYSTFELMGTIKDGSIDDRGGLSIDKENE